MQKEILTKEVIVKDLKRILIKEILLLVIMFPLLLFMYYLILSHIPFLGLTITATLCISFCIFLTIVYFYELLRAIIPLFQLKKFKITSDFVTDKLTKRGNTPHSLHLPRPYTLIFSRDNKYRIPNIRIPNIKNSIWSDLFGMWDKEFYNSTDLGDDFYLISIPIRKNILAYSKKMFEYKEN